MATKPTWTIDTETGLCYLNLYVDGALATSYSFDAGDVILVCRLSAETLQLGDRVVQHLVYQALSETFQSRFLFACQRP